MGPCLTTRLTGWSVALSTVTMSDSLAHRAASSCRSPLRAPSSVTVCDAVIGIVWPPAAIVPGVGRRRRPRGPRRASARDGRPSTFLARTTVFGSTVISFRRATTSGVHALLERARRGAWRGTSRPRPYIAMLFTGRAKPWPSSGARRYSTGKPRSRSAMTICSDSAFFTRGSFAPCTTSSGVLIFAAELSGDWRSSCFLPSGVSGRPCARGRSCGPTPSTAESTRAA